ncbi:MAG: formate dehydrogenase [Gammaproteobacteria bacterium]|nr:formate dehydrogenase [Gammaproteobacteria bacterium]MYF29919.1 formate dehydrogenase [Gammaproteobacteria bacterium]MYK45499.1 formate dehydrogenase [Gammaproteobacteria bacterium]
MTTAFVPLDTAAVAAGADAVAAAIADTGTEIVRNGSRGMCWAEPAMEVEYDGARLAFGNVEASDVPGIFQQHERHAKYLGKISEIDYLQRQTRAVFDRAGTSHPLELPNTTFLEECLGRDAESLIAEIETSGLRGRGGAGFPAHIKWRTVFDTPGEQKYIVCNADEGDSGTFADRILMEGDPYRLIEGMTIAGLATGATKGYVYLRSEYPIAADIFQAALDNAYAEDLLGTDILGSGQAFDLELFIGAGAYICGEETSLLESLEGKRGEIRVKPPVPAISGLFGAPTLVHNVISFAAVPAIMKHSGAWYADMGVGRSTGTMAFQLAGNVQRGGLIEVPFGITIDEIVNGFGGGTRSGRPIRTIQIGGPLGAYLKPEEFDTPLTYEAIAELGAGIGHGGIVVFDDTVDLARQAHYAFEFCEVESCGKCTPCRLGSVRGKETMSGIIEGRDVEQKLTIIEDLCEVMETASLCQMGGMTPIPVMSAIKRFPEDFRR